jgi:hypothetical protein
MPKTAQKFIPNLAGSLKTLITGREVQSGVLLFLLKIHGRFSDCKPLSLNLNWPWTFVRGVSPNISDELALSKYLKRMVGAFLSDMRLTLKPFHIWGIFFLQDPRHHFSF